MRGVAGYRSGLREKRQLQAAFEEGRHVGGKRPVPVLDAYSRPFEPEWKFFEVTIDGKVKMAPFGIFHPPPIGSGRREAGEICDQQRAAGFQNPGHLADRRSEIDDIDQREVADNQIEAGRLEFKLLGIAGPVVAGWIALPCHLEQLTGRIDPGRSHAGGLQHPAETALAAAHIQRTPEPACRHAAEHDRIEHVLAAPISALAHGVDPGLR